MKSLFGRHCIHKVLLYRQGESERVFVQQVLYLPPSNRLALKGSTLAPADTWSLAGKVGIAWNLGIQKIEEAFHHSPNSNHVEASGLTAGLPGKRWASPQPFYMKFSQGTCGSYDKRENPLSKSTEIQWISAVSLLQKATVLNNQVLHPKAHFLGSLFLEGLMGSDFPCIAVNSPRVGSQQKPTDYHWIPWFWL